MVISTIETKKVEAFWVDYGTFKTSFESVEEAVRADECRKWLEARGWKFLNWNANEALNVAGAWYEDDNFVYCLTDCEPYVDAKPITGPSINFPDPFNAPVHKMKTCGLEIWRKPFPTNPAGETWEMDGCSPTNFDERNQTMAFMMFTSVRSAEDFVKLTGSPHPLKLGDKMKTVSIRGHREDPTDVPAAKNNPVEMTLTVTQAKMLYTKWCVATEWAARPKTFQLFLDTVQPTVAMDGAVVVGWCSMFLCIEKDGYCHS